MGLRHQDGSDQKIDKSSIRSNDVRAEVRYAVWSDLFKSEKPFEVFVGLPEDAKDCRKSNVVFENTETLVRDVRGKEDQFTLNENGFKYCKHRTAVENFDQQDVVKEKYLPEMEAFIRKEVEDVDRVFFFDWRLRRYRKIPEEGPLYDLNDLSTYLTPSMECHVDQSPRSAVRRVQLQLKDEADFLLRGRVRIINTWCPLIDSVEDYPLGICDGRTIEDKDLLATDHVRKHYLGEINFIIHNEAQRWHYMSKQGKEDLLIVKIFDSDKTVPSKFSPHGAFRLPDIPPEAEPRKSIETRALVFTYPKDEEA